MSATCLTAVKQDWAKSLGRLAGAEGQGTGCAGSAGQRRCLRRHSRPPRRTATNGRCCYDDQQIAASDQERQSVIVPLVSAFKFPL